MIKFFTFILAFCILAFVAAAQAPGTTVVLSGSGSPTGSCNSGSIYTNASSGNFWVCTSSAWQNVSGSLQVSSLPATCTPSTSSAVQLTVTNGIYGAGVVYYCDSTNHWSPVSQGSGAGPTVAWYLGPQCPPSNTSQCFYSPANTQQNNNCGWTSGSPNITCWTSVPNISGSVTSNVATYTAPGVGLIPSSWVAGDTLSVFEFTGSDTYFNQTCTIFTVTATTVTCPLTHANASSTNIGIMQDKNQGPFVAGDVGKQLAGWKNCAAFISDGTGAFTAAGAPTILTYTSSTAIVASANATNSVTGNTSCLIWGTPDDSYAVTAETAYTNATTCPRLILSAGYYMFTSPHFSTNPNACANNPAQFPITPPGNVFYAGGFELEGRGVAATELFLMPNFPNGDTCSRGGYKYNNVQYGSAAGFACFAIPPLGTWKDFQITGGGNLLYSPAAQHSLIYATVANIDHITCTNLGGWDPLNQFIGIELGWQVQLQQYNNSGCGAVGERVDASQGEVTAFRQRIENSSSIGTTVGLNSSFTCYDCAWYSTQQVSPTGGALYGIFNTGGTVYLYHTIINDGGSPVQSIPHYGYNAVTAGSNLYTHNSKFSEVTSNAGNISIYCTAACNNWLEGTTLTQGASGNVYKDVSGSFLRSLGGNTAVSGTFSVNAGGSLQLAPTDYTSGSTGIAPTCTFTSGGGSSPSCALCSGNPTNERGCIVATTGTGSPGTTGTITLTFVGTFSQAGLPICTYTLDDSGTAWGNEATVRVSTQSSTAPVLAWTNLASGTLTALATSSPYRIGYACANR